jgi:hypothetical protein
MAGTKGVKEKGGLSAPLSTADVLNGSKTHT